MKRTMAYNKLTCIVANIWKNRFRLGIFYQRQMMLSSFLGPSTEVDNKYGGLSTKYYCNIFVCRV